MISFHVKISIVLAKLSDLINKPSKTPKKSKCLLSFPSSVPLQFHLSRSTVSLSLLGRTLAPLTLIILEYYSVGFTMSNITLDKVMVREILVRLACFFNT